MRLPYECRQNNVQLSTLNVQLLSSETMFQLDKLIRENIRNLKPYSSARDEFRGEADIFLDANENAFGSPLSVRGSDACTLDSARSDRVLLTSANYNRYPDPLQIELKEKLSQIKGVPAGNIFLGNGSDEVIDLLYRSFCNPGIDNVILVPPTYGMYEVSAHINDVHVRNVPLTKEFQLDVEAISENVDENTKLILICSPNNPTGNSMDKEDVEFILNNFHGIIVVDEAYINYSRQRSFISELTEYPNLVVMQTLSKAWGMAGARIGMAFASDDIISILNKVKPPYSVGSPAQQLALEALNNMEQVNEWIKITVQERQKLMAALGQIPFVKKIYPSDANFLLVKMDDAGKVYDYLTEHGIVVRDRSRVEMCEGCLRMTVGTPKENQILINKMEAFKI
jgi:histidinol-phosphate aminotransferase